MGERRGELTVPRDPPGGANHAGRCVVRVVRPAHGAIGGTTVADGGRVPLQQDGGGAKLDEFDEQLLRHPQPDSGISMANANRARTNRLLSMAAPSGRAW